MDLVLGGYDAAESYDAIVINHNRGLPCGVVCSNVEPRVFTDAYRVAKADAGCPLSAYITRAMKPNSTPN
jgi:hypothetical protein